MSDGGRSWKEVWMAARREGEASCAPHGNARDTVGVGDGDTVRGEMAGERCW